MYGCAMTSPQLPLPPLDLAVRVGELGGDQPWAQYEAIGSSLKAVISSSLPADWSWDGRRGLDFGAGAGRVLRHFGPEARSAELWGCDIDAGSVFWLRDNLCPPFHAFLVSEEPRLPQTDGFFDLAWALSVFTHLGRHWAGWLAELHRVLKPGGLLIVSYMGAEMARQLLGGAWDENRSGMSVVGAGRPWSEGGPWVFHSEWWLRCHWGRGFEVVRLDRNDVPGTHGLLVLAKRPVAITAEELERPETGEPRELAALATNVSQLHGEDVRVRARLAQLEARLSRRWTARVRRRIASTVAGAYLQALRDGGINRRRGS